MSPTRILLAAALAGLPALAHHQEPSTGAYLAFWSGNAAPPAIDLATGTCSDNGVWEKAFISIYSQVGVGE